MSRVVDLGILLSQFLYKDIVATMLLRKGVQFSVIVRVLSEPQFGRRNDSDG